jgi:NADPH:quinone reductase-like Zn-dependent oxidoreductase
VVRAVLVDVASAGLVVADVADPVARPGQLLVGVRAAGLNRADLAVRAGTHDRTRPGTARAAAPFVAGSELAGDVLAVGAGVEGWGTGDRVMGLGQGYAELAVIDAGMAMPVPDGLTWEEAGALPVALLTMHDALGHERPMAPRRDGPRQRGDLGGRRDRGAAGAAPRCPRGDRHLPHRGPSAGGCPRCWPTTASASSIPATPRCRRRSGA